MPKIRAITCRRGEIPARALACLAAGALLLLANAAVAQDRGAAKSDPAAAQQETDILQSIGRWFERSWAKLNSGYSDVKANVENLGREAGVAVKSTANVAKDAAGAVVRIPGTRVVSARELCVRAANGAPDCVAAANAVCRGKGFGSGTSLATESAQKCPARVWLSGRLPAEGECATETFITRALCQ